MRGLVTFQPVDLEFFDELIGSLVEGKTVNPESYVETALALRVASRECARYKVALELLLKRLEPPSPPVTGTVWEKVRARLERFDHRPGSLVRLVAAYIDPDLHLHGRPFLVTEGSAEHVAARVGEFAEARGEATVSVLALDQLGRLDPALARDVAPEELDELSADPAYRNELLQGLREIFELAEAARLDTTWGAAGRREQAREVLARELPWRAAFLHSRAVPFWIARDVDGLETICRMARIEPPAFLAPAWRLCASADRMVPELAESMTPELEGPREVGAFVAPGDVPELLSFLGDQGAGIIRTASRHGEGPACATLLRKIREVVCYAEKRGMGYLEASGIEPHGLKPTGESLSALGASL